jgi:hypothetical protein
VLAAQLLGFSKWYAVINTAALAVTRFYLCIMHVVISILVLCCSLPRCAAAWADRTAPFW